MMTANGTSYTAITPGTFLEAMFPDASDAVRDGSLEVAEMTSAVHAALANFIPNAVVAFGFGSAFRGAYRAWSDVDVVAFVEESSRISNYCFMSNGVPVDLHIFGLDRIDAIVAHARQTRACSILSSVCEGVVLLDMGGRADALRSRLMESYAAPPGPALDRDLRALRWTITTQMLDLAQDRPQAEVYAAALTAYPLLVQLFNAARGGWRNRGKWTVRTDLAGENLLLLLANAYLALYRDGNKTMLLQAGVRILDLAGGALCLGQGTSLNLDQP